jgi:hypothetical protein
LNQSRKNINKSPVSVNVILSYDSCIGRLFLCAHSIIITISHS